MTKRIPQFTLNIMTSRVDKDLESKLFNIVQHVTWKYDNRRPVSVYICDEESMSEIYEKYYGSNKPLEDLYSHRGFCNPGNRVIACYYTKYETDESIKWILQHELCHYHISLSYAIKNWVYKRNQQQRARYNHIKINYHDDIVHESDFEETICNDYANYSMEDKCYDRIWWRYQKENYVQENDTGRSDPACTGEIENS